MEDSRALKKQRFEEGGPSEDSYEDSRVREKREKKKRRKEKKLKKEKAKEERRLAAQARCAPSRTGEASRARGSVETGISAVQGIFKAHCMTCSVPVGSVLSMVSFSWPQPGYRWGKRRISSSTPRLK